MIRTLTFIFLFIAALSATGQKKWQKDPLKIDPVVCYGSDEMGHAFIAPPEEFLHRMKSTQKRADIIVQYVNFPDSLKPAFEYAIEIWESLISSDVPIYLQANWFALGSGTLANCGASDYYVNFEGAPYADTYYPVAIVEKITRKEITGPGSPDMIARFNLSAPWYKGIDGKTPSNKYDFVSTVLHEIAHGLGFTGFFDVRASNSTGWYGNQDDIPAIYDRFVEDFNRRRLTNTNFFLNPSGEIYNALVSNQLYSGSPVAYTWGKNARPQLYAPSVFNDGSSIYHLNDASYFYGDENSLMTSSAGRGEAIHSPGPLTSGIMADIGWKHLFIDYTPLKDVEELTVPLRFEVSIASDIGVRKNSLCLVWSADGFKTKADTVFFPHSDLNAAVSFLPAVTQGIVSYYISVQDSIGRTFTDPVKGRAAPYILRIGSDTIKPVISHTPLKYVLSAAREMDISATVTDNIAVDSVFIHFTVNGSLKISTGLVRGEEDIFSGKFPIYALNLKGGDSIQYVLEARDVSRNKNRTFYPATGQVTIKVEGVNGPVENYSTNFNGAIPDFILSDFSIAQPFGFDSPALHSQHPYPSPDTDDQTFEFTTLLRKMIILSDSTRMSYDEVVLIEPGEEGTVFGDDQFWDYVIVEGSKDFGKSWKPLVNGYDSGSLPSWETIWNKQITGNNSTSLGTKELYARRSFLLTGNGNFKQGDTLLIRFRLFSDPYSHGWGWAVDNLTIERFYPTQARLTLSPGNIRVWPNPAENHLYLEFAGSDIPRNAEIEIMDIMGRKLYRQELTGLAPGSAREISIRGIPSGVFILIVKNEGSPVLIRKMIKR